MLDKIITSKNESGKVNVVAFEGAPFSGKTTLIRKLHEKYGVKFVKEYAEYANGGNDFPPFPSKNFDDAKKSVRFMVDIEKRRCEEAYDIAINSELPVIMDRSPLSCIVFQKTVEVLHPEYPSVYAYSVEAFLKAYDDGKIFFPQIMIYIQPPELQAFQNRVINRGATPINMFNDHKCGKIMELWYKHCITMCFSELNHKIIPSNNNQIENNVDFVGNFILNEADYQSNPYNNISKLSSY